MRALWLVRSNLHEHPGGDTTQIDSTAAALRARGIEITLDSSADPPIDGHDVVHLFHLDRLWELLPYCRRLRSAGQPTVLSTIYWPSDEIDRFARRGLQGTLARTVGSRRYATLRVWQRAGLDALLRGNFERLAVWGRTFGGAARELLHSVDVILPNSALERDLLAQRFGESAACVVVPNAVDLARIDSSTPATQRQGVLCVGRLEPRKNQLALIQALHATDVPLTLIGGAGRFNAAYADACRRAAGPRTTFIDQIAPAALGAHYAAARVHACVSWYETPGLASLEAAAAGCALVITPGGCTREYFGDGAQYCDPHNPSSIRSAVEAALATSPPPALAERVRHEFTWEAAATATFRGYQLAQQVSRRRTSRTETHEG